MMLVARTEPRPGCLNMNSGEDEASDSENEPVDAAERGLRTGIGLLLGGFAVAAAGALTERAWGEMAGGLGFLAMTWGGLKTIRIAKKIGSTEQPDE